MQIAKDGQLARSGRHPEEKKINPSGRIAREPVGCSFSWDRLHPAGIPVYFFRLSPGPLLSFVLIQKKVSKEKIKKMALASNSSF